MSAQHTPGPLDRAIFEFGRAIEMLEELNRRGSSQVVPPSMRQALRDLEALAAIAKASKSEP